MSRRYQQWKGKNTFLLNGSIVLGSHPYQLLLSIIIMAGSWLTFCVSILPFMHNPYTYYVATFLIVVTFTTCIATATTDPGIYPRREVYNGTDIFREELQTFAGEKYCAICCIRRHSRARHCKFCDNCVDVFDHHCPWLGTCIGVRNYVQYYCFVVSVAVSVLFMIGSTIWVWLHWIIAWQRGYFSIFADIWSWLFRILVILFSIMLLFVLVLIGALLVLHTYLVCSRQTTGEFIRSRRSKLSSVDNKSLVTFTQPLATSIFSQNKVEKVNVNNIEEGSQRFHSEGLHSASQFQSLSISPLTSPPLVDETPSAERSIETIANKAVDTLSWFSFLQWRVVANVCSTSRRHSGLYQRPNQSEQEVDAQQDEMHNDSIDCGGGTKENNDKFVSEVNEFSKDHQEDASVYPVSSLSFKSASYQPKESVIFCCLFNKVNTFKFLRECIPQIVCCYSKQRTNINASIPHFKPSSSSSSASSISSQLSSASTIMQTKFRLKNPQHQWERIPIDSSAAQENIEDSKIPSDNVKLRAQEPSWFQSTRLLPMWQYCDHEDEHAQKHLTDQVFALLQQSEAQSHLFRRIPYHRTHFTRTKTSVSPTQRDSKSTKHRNNFYYNGENDQFLSIFSHRSSNTTKSGSGEEWSSSWQSPPRVRSELRHVPPISMVGTHSLLLNSASTSTTLSAKGVSPVKEIVYSRE